eukprot:scaffold42800_cov52-Attheya_sp.AAC.5
MRRLSLQPSDKEARHACWRHGSYINGDRRIRRRNDASTFASSAQTCRERSSCSTSDGSNVPELQHWQRQMYGHSHGVMSSRLILFSQQHTHLFAARSFTSKMPKKIDLRSIIRQPVEKTAPDAPGSKKIDLRSIMRLPVEKTDPDAPGSQSMMKQNDAIKSSTSDIDSSKQTDNAVLPTSAKKMLAEIAPIAPVSVNADANPVPEQEEAHTYGDLLIQNDIKGKNDNPVPKQEEVWTDGDWRIQKDIKENSIAPVSDYVYADPVPKKEEAQTYETPVLPNNEDDSSRTRLDSEEPPNETRRGGSMDNVQFVDGPATQFGSGVIANLCHGSIVGTAGSTVVLSTVVLDSSSEGPNFGNSGMAPLQVEYRERHHGVGRIPTNSRRRDNTGPMTDDEILASRAIDRVLRPLLPQESYSSTLAITCSVQACGRHSHNIVNDHQANPTSGDPVALAINSASAALVQSGLPFEGPVGCVRLCLVDGNIVQNPTPAQLEDSSVELLYAGTHDRALMLEMSSRKKPDVSSYDEKSSKGVGISEVVVADMIRLAQSAIQPLIEAQRHLSPKTEEFDDYALAMDLGIPFVRIEETNVHSATSDRSKQDILYRQVIEEAYEFIHEKLGPVALRLFGVDDASTPNIKSYEKYAPASIHEEASKTSPLVSKRMRGRREHLVRNEIRRLLREDFKTKDEESQLLTEDVLDSSLNAMTDVIHGRLLRWALAKCTTTYRCRGDGRRENIRNPSDEPSDGALVIRPIYLTTPIFPDVVHGSAMFSRGETQVLCTATLGAPREGRPVTNPFSSVSERKKVDPNLQKGPYYDLPIGSLRFLRSETSLVSDYNSKKVKADRELTGDSGTFDEVQRAFLHYDFPAYSTGQVQKGGAAVANRRAIGHGTLAEKAILPILPPPSLFPYAIRLTSEVTSSNGSSSMASVCGATIALLDAGVPILSPVAGVSVGLVMDPDKNDNDVDDSADLYTCLLDITGTEDHYGEMDFKIAGTANGITAMQLDVKRPLPIEVLVRAMYVAKSGRRRILKTMQSQCQLYSYGIISKLKPRKHLKLSAPRVAIVRFDPLRKRDLIGPGGAVLRQMEDRFGISLDLTQEGQCLLYGQDADLVAKARSAVMDLVADVEEGEIYEGTVIEIKDFGAIVELLRNKEGLLHVSELSDDISNSLRVDDSYGVAKEHLTVGQKIDVLCIGVDTVQGSIKLSRKRLQAAADSLSTIPGGVADNQTNLAEMLQANAVLTATNTTMSTQLAQIMQGMQLLQTQMAARHTGDTPTSVQGGQSAPRVPWTYCWSHGICKHSGAICKNKKEGHKDAATMENKMGGSTSVQGSQSAPRVPAPSVYCWSHGMCKHSGAICKNKKEGHKDAATMENKMGGSTRNM